MRNAFRWDRLGHNLLDTNKTTAFSVNLQTHVFAWLLFDSGKHEPLVHRP